MASMDHFPTGTAGLAAAHRPELVELGDGDRFEVRIAPVTKRIGDATVRMLAYNGSIPGPTLKVRESCEVDDVLLDVTNVGRWMAHGHIAERHESGMMFSFGVTA